MEGGTSCLTLPSIAAQGHSTIKLPEHVRATGHIALKAEPAVTIPYPSVQPAEDSSPKTFAQITTGGEDLSADMVAELHRRCALYVGITHFQSTGSFLLRFNLYHQQSLIL